MKSNPDRWLWYAARTRRCVPLDPTTYPSIDFDSRPRPLPAWVCQAPDGGLHVHSREGRIDIDVAEAPTPRIELNYTCPYGVRIVSRAWLSEIRDFIDESRVFIGEVRRNGRPLENWATIHELNAPPLLSSEGRGKRCPICGSVWMTLWGRIFFADRGVAARPLIVTSYGIFVREDLALSRELRKPTGAFKPRVVRLNQKVADRLFPTERPSYG